MDINLAVGQAHAQHRSYPGAFEEVCARPSDWVVVGDVSSTIATPTQRKLASSSPRGSQLRSGDMSMPEEISRLCTDAICGHAVSTDEFANQVWGGGNRGADSLYGQQLIDSLLQHIKRHKRNCRKVS